MTFSPYQHQDPRQISLQRQIEQSRQEGDIRRLQRLELQWVHRFGVASLPGVDRPMLQPEIHRTELEQEIEQPSGIGRFTALLRDSLDDVARALDDHLREVADAPVPARDLAVRVAVDAPDSARGREQGRERRPLRDEARLAQPRLGRGDAVAATARMSRRHSASRTSRSCSAML